MLVVFMFIMGLGMNIVVLFLFLYFLLLILKNIYMGIRNVDGVFLEFGKVMGMIKW